MRTVDMVTQLVLTIGGMNWLLIGLLQYDVIVSVFGSQRTPGAQAIYIFVGLCAIWMAFRAPFLVGDYRTAGRSARSDGV